MLLEFIQKNPIVIFLNISFYHVNVVKESRFDPRFLQLLLTLFKQQISSL